MSGIGEMFKKVPLPIWIGLGLVLIVILLMNRGGSSSSNQQQTTAATPTAAAGPVTTATVGTQGTQGGAGTDQELGNLSVLTQGGFSQIAQQDQQLTTQLASLQANGVGTPMQQFGGAIQSTQTTSAQTNATNGTPGQNAGSSPSTMSTPTG
jgi:hypothetical protein